MRDGLAVAFLCGDVMTGRGVDQILPHPGHPRLWEDQVRDARTYVELAEAANAAIPRPVDYSWPWGDALSVLEEHAPDARVLNLETTITRSGDAAPAKAVHYRMDPRNIPCLTALRPDVCALANNHVLDFGYGGLADTRQALAEAGVSAVGAGRDLDEAGQPAVVPVPGGPRFVIFSIGTRSSGIPPEWAATPDRPGVDLGPDQLGTAADALVERMAAAKSPGDVLVASVHWGPNWGYRVVPDHVGLAHRLVDGGVDIVHGHSSHHVRPIELYKGRLILYGCGDFVDDYEGIGGYEDYRDDLRVMFFAAVEPDTGRLVRLQMAPMQARQIRLHHAADTDKDELRRLLSQVSHDFGSRFNRTAHGMVELAMDRL
jgi:poly-gamma-glutamate capsule biosynthesis protein CapA/YwtB (metallophosphatase superfamily)